MRNAGNKQCNNNIETIETQNFASLPLIIIAIALMLLLPSCGGAGGALKGSSPASNAGVSWGSLVLQVFAPMAREAGGASVESKEVEDVKDAPPGYQPLAGARVSVVGQNKYATTDSRGYARIDEITPGSYTVTVGKDGYEALTYNNVGVSASADTRVGSASGIVMNTSTTPGILDINPASGIGGDSITITGSNFGASQGSSIVTFNGTAATSVISWSSTSIVCNVPIGAMTGNVVVTVGGTASNGVSFTVNSKIIIEGDFTTCNGAARNRIARLNSDGSLDASFDPGTGANAAPDALAVQSDGKILLGGEFTTYNGTARSHIVRINSDGSLDTSFNPGTGTDDNVASIAVQSDGKVLIGGGFTTYNGTARLKIARLNSDGSLDASFNPGTGGNDPVLSIAVQADGKILIGGEFTTYNGTARNRVARLNSDGSLDTSFDPGEGANNDVESIDVLSTGKILIGGDFTFYDDIARNRVARLNSDGSLDNSFFPNAGASWSVQKITGGGSGKTLIGGDFTTYNGTARNRIARINYGGTLDATFDPGTGANGRVSSIEVQDDDKILIGGSFTTYNSTAQTYIARLNSDGSLDISFASGIVLNNSIDSLAIQ